jgi:hypothetical protein
MPHESGHVLTPEEDAERRRKVLRNLGYSDDTIATFPGMGPAPGPSAFDPGLEGLAVSGATPATLPIQSQPPTVPPDLSGITASRYWPAVPGWGKDIALGIASLLSAPALGAYPSKVAPDKRKALEPTLEAFKAFEELMAPAKGQSSVLPSWVYGLEKRDRVIARHDALVAKGLDQDSAWAGAWKLSREAGDIPWQQDFAAGIITDPFNPLLFAGPSAAHAGLKGARLKGAGLFERMATADFPTPPTPPMTQALAVQPKPFQVQPALGQIDPTQVIPPGPSALDFLGRPIVPERAPLGLETRGQVTPFVQRDPIPLPEPAAAARVGDAPPLTEAGQRARDAKTFTIGFENTLAIRKGQLQAAQQEVRNIEAKIAAAPKRLAMPETGTPQDRFLRGEAEWVLDPSNAQLAAAKAAEKQARVALRDVQTKTRGRIAKAELAERDEGLGRVIAPTEELIPGTGITSDTFPYPAGSVLKGLKYPLRHYTDGSLRRMAKGKTERARFYAAELAKREAEEAAEAAGSLARREAGEAVRDFPTAVGSPRQPRAQFPEVVIEEAVPTARGTGPTPTTAPVTRGADAPITPVTPVVAREVAGEIPTTPTGPTTVRVGEGVAEAMPVTPAATQEALVARLIQVIRGAKRLAAPTARAISRERARRGRNIESALASTGGPEGRRRAFGAAKGEIEVPTFEPPAGAFTPAEGEILQEMIRTRFMNDGYDWMPTQTAFEKLFAGGRIPAPHEIQLLEEVFGPELIQAVLTQRSKGKKAFELFIEIWNVPKALKASYDLSATLRQGAYLLMEGKPAKDAFKAQLKAVRSKKGFDEVNEAIVANEWYARAVNWGLDMTLPRKGRGLLGREEEFIGAELAKRIPIIGRGVKLSERAYTAFLNKMRMDTFTKYAKDLDRMGATEAEFKKLASSINIMTGRGELGPLTEAAMILNLPFFSPRFFISRFQLLGTLATKNPVLARMAAKNIVGYIGFVTSMLSLAHFSGVGRVEWDSRSSDFGKLRIKGTNTRLDPFAGVQQAVVFVTHLFGKRKVTGTGEIVNVDPREATGYFLENKLSPSAATSLSLKRGKLRFDKEFTPFNILYELLAPIPIGDVWDAIDDAGPLLGSALGAYAVAGGGVQTFGFPDWQEDFKPYFKIPTDPLERRIKGTRGNREEYRKNNPEVDAKLWITGAVTTLKTDAAASYAKAFVQEHGIDPTTIKAVKEYQEKTKRLTEAGLDRGRVTWQRKVHNEFIREILAEEAAPMPTGTRTPTAPAPTAEFERIRKLGEEAVRRFLAEEVGAPR